MRGRVRGDGDLVVEATVEGEVVVSGALELGQGSEVQGGVEAASVTVSGSLTGDVNAAGAVAITASGRLVGDVRASEVSLEEGGQFVGRVDADFDLPSEIA